MKTLERIHSYSYEGLKIPVHMRGPLGDYIDFGWEPGEFLEAVLGGDLSRATYFADHLNIHCLRVYTTFLSNYAPPDCFGSPEKVKAWVADKRAKRQKEPT